MAKNKNRKNLRKFSEKKQSPFRLGLLAETKKKILGVILAVFALILVLSFFDLAGRGGILLKGVSTYLIGKVAFSLPLLFITLAILFFKTEYRRIYLAVLLGVLIFILGLSGMLGLFPAQEKLGGNLGYLISQPIFQIFEFWASLAIFATLSLIGLLILAQFFFPKREKEVSLEEKPPSLIKKIFLPKFKVKEIPPIFKKEQIFPQEKEKAPQPISQPEVTLEMEKKPIEEKTPAYQRPPLDLLEADSGRPSAGDIQTNSAIIKRTLQNFDISVEMGQVNIGPTVTQYTLKPAEGVKLSKITALNNDLSLALAAHPIRIEAPIPGKSLVGIEIPNKSRTLVRMRNLMALPDFQRSISDLTFVLGRDVTGLPVFADLSKMPHLLLAGSTGTGKTICLNNLIVSLLYRNSPEILKFILIDPKRVEFPVYNSLDHLLTPVIFEARQAVNVLKWLINEMERRFEIFSAKKTRDILSYNQATQKEGSVLLPYIILIIDELADLMSARGREVEAGIVRLAQMARAVGIHLVVATQRPSVEVVTGLIKANITSRIAFQVASQVDSRTVFDMAGAEKLLGSGDMLYISSEIAKPKRIQAAYISEKETKKVVNWISSKESLGSKTERIELEELEKSIEKSLEREEEFDIFTSEEDPLYEEAKRVVIEARKASASLLQRRLRIGYARAARLIDVLEERGVVGPGEGAKPREIYISENDQRPATNDQ